MTSPFLQIDHLKTYFPVYRGGLFQRRKGMIRAVDDVSFYMEKGEVLGLVGESGCGKSTLGRSIMQLDKITSGTITFDGRALNRLSEKARTHIRSRFQMIFQDPYGSLNPRMTVFDALAEPMVYHGRVEKHQVMGHIAALMRDVGMDPGNMRKYPHEFSGGQRQRIAVARALTLKPDLMIADEPVSALDVSVQSQILNVLISLIQKYGLTMLFISHDLSVIRHIATRTAVMYLGKIVEIGRTEDVFDRPAHPYTRALFSAVLFPDPDREKIRKKVLLKGEPPSPLDPPQGCRFHTRCPMAEDRCETAEPEFRRIDDGSDGRHHLAACHFV